MNKLLALASTAAALVGAWSSAQAATVLKLDSAATCGKGGCFFNTSSSYQKALTGPVSLSHLTIDKAMLGEYADKAIKISFTTADGRVVGSWGSFTLAALAGDWATVGGADVDWFGEAGDLILKIEVVLPSTGAAGGGFARSSIETLRGGAIVLGGGPAPETGGAQEEAETPAGRPAAAVSGAPEPGVWALMIGGFGLSGVTLRTRRRAI